MTKEAGAGNPSNIDPLRDNDRYKFGSMSPNFLFVEGEIVNEVLVRHSSGMSEALSAMRADYRTGRDFIRRLRGAIVSPRWLEGLFSHSRDALGSMADAGIRFDDSTMRLLTASISRDAGAFISRKSFREKLVSTCISHAKAGESELKLPDPKGSGIAIDLTEEEAAVMGRKIIHTIRSTERDVAMSVRSGSVEVIGENDEKKVVQTEFYDAIGAICVRVGNLFFVDAKFRDKLPPDVSAFADSNIIFVKSMFRSELSNNIGYYTTNTIASMMNADMHGDIVLDCGTGSGMLSLAALRLGARGLVAVERDAEKVRHARKNLDENGYAGNRNIKVVQADLITQGNKILAAFDEIEDKGNVTIVSDIGSWSDYPVSNLTSFSYIDDLNKISGWRVATVVSGGHSYLEKVDLSHEVRFISTRGIDFEHFPREDMAFDQAFLEHIGFRRVAGAFSQALGNPGQPAHTPKSMVMVNTVN